MRKNKLISNFYSVQVFKNIPVFAGLGGGNSNDDTTGFVGGSSYWGGGAAGAGNNTSNEYSYNAPYHALVYGAGGGPADEASNTTGTGSNGAPGVVYVEEYK